MKMVPFNYLSDLHAQGKLAKTSTSLQSGDRCVRFIRLADLIISVDCVVSVKFSTYPAYIGHEVKDVPIVNLWLKLPTGSLDGNAEQRNEQVDSLEELEFEGELALSIWSYFGQLDTVAVLVE